MDTKLHVSHNENNIVQSSGDVSKISTNTDDQHGDVKTAGHENYHGIDTRALHMGADEVYEKKISIMNEALIDLGMGSFQWKIFAMTGFGWFVDNVRSSFSILHC